MKAWISHLPLARKFLVIGIVALLMLALPATLLIRSDLRKLRTANEQAEGLPLAVAVIEIVHLTQQHRGLVAVAASGDATSVAARDAKHGEVARHFAALVAEPGMAQRSGLQTTAQRLAADWPPLAGGGTDVAQSFQRHTALIQALLGLLEDITYATGIVLVPDQGTYFLQAGVLRELPRLVEAFGQARAMGARMLGRGGASARERAEIALLSATVQGSFDEARKLLELAVRDDTQARARIDKVLATALQAARDGLQVIDQRVVSAESYEFPAAQYFDTVTQAIEAQFGLVAEATAVLQANLRREADTARTELATMLAGCTALALLAAWIMIVIARTTTASVCSALALAEAVAAGDLTARIDSNARDETGRLLRALGAMTESLRQVVGEVRAGVDAVSTASQQIAEGNANLASRTEATAGSLEQTAASMEELTSTVVQSADTSRQASELADTAAQVAVSGGGVVRQVVASMSEISAASKKIADIIGVIDGIAFQTNILALNAAVEAARAGEQGRGFAVVAGEVRTLAGRSAEAAKEIKALIDRSVQTVAAGSAQVAQAGVSMEEIVASVKQVSGLITELAAAATEQRDGIAQVNQAVTHLDQMTQQNAALVEESSAAAASMRDQATRLADVVAVFKVGAQGGPAAARVDARPVAAIVAPTAPRRLGQA